MVARATACLPQQGPIGVFIHHNTLHAFEEEPFEEAVVHAARVFGTEPFLTEARYREELTRGRIRFRDLEAVLDADLGDRANEFLAGGRVTLVTLPRVFGYLFNPVSFYFCYDRTGAPVAALAEVTNTFREMKPYVLGPETRDPATPATFALRTPKHFYVSPFSDVDVAFDFTLRAPGEKLSIQIDDYVGAERTLTSTLAGPRRALTGPRLAWFTLKYPALTLRIIGLIHWHALLLWLKRVPWFAKSARAADQRALYRPHASIAPTTEAA
jgi:DUF1365 family protein